MLNHLYVAAINAYATSVYVAAFFNRKAKLWVDGRKNWKKKIAQIDFSTSKWIWIHCASLGEYNDGLTVIEQLRNLPGFKLLITFFSPTGYEHLKGKNIADLVMYLPIDTPANAKYFIEKVQPAVAIFSRNDIWPVYLQKLKEAKIPSLLFSFFIHSDSRFLPWPQRIIYKSAFKNLSKILVRDELSAKILQSAFRLSNVEICGNTRIDCIYSRYKEGNELGKIKQFVNDSFCVVAGSMLPKDEQILLKAIDTCIHENIKFIIVPHEIDNKRINAIVQQNKAEMEILSEMGSSSTAKILWVDCVGILADIYRYASVVFIGGGFNKIGIHNIIEPAVHACPVAFGPNHRNYPEALEILKLGAEIIYNSDNLSDFVLRYYKAEDKRKHNGEANREFVMRNAGATKIVMQEIRKYI